MLAKGKLGVSAAGSRAAAQRGKPQKTKETCGKLYQAGASWLPLAVLCYRQTSGLRKSVDSWLQMVLAAGRGLKVRGWCASWRVVLGAPCARAQAARAVRPSWLAAGRVGWGAGLGGRRELDLARTCRAKGAEACTRARQGGGSTIPENRVT